MRLYIVIIKDEDQLILEEILSTSLEYAMSKFKKGAKYNKFYRNARLSAEWKMTSDGLHRITTVQMLKKGDYFHTVDKYGDEGKTVYVRGQYDHSREKYECCKFHDMNSCRYFNRDQLVTDEMTF